MAGAPLLKQVELSSQGSRPSSNLGQNTSEIVNEDTDISRFSPLRVSYGQDDIADLVRHIFSQACTDELSPPQLRSFRLYDSYEAAFVRRYDQDRCLDQ